MRGFLITVAITRKEEQLRAEACTLKPQDPPSYPESRPDAGEFWYESHETTLPSSVAHILLTKDFPQTTLTFTQRPLQEDQNLEEKRTKNESPCVTFPTRGPV